MIFDKLADLKIVIGHNGYVIVGFLSLSFLLSLRLINLRYRCACRQFRVLYDLIIDYLLQSDMINMSWISRFMWLNNNLLSLIAFLLYRDVAEAKVRVCGHLDRCLIDIIFILGSVVEPGNKRLLILIG